MREGWEIKRLGDVVEVLDNLRKPITKRDRVEGKYPYYGATGILSYVHNYIFSEKLVLIGEDGAKWLSGDDTSFIAEGKYWVNNHAHVIRPIRKIILDEWIVHFLNFSDLIPFITGMTVPKLNQEKMRSIPIPLPPLSEQQRIVSILEEAFAAIDKAKANAQQNLKNAKELFESYLQQTFSRNHRLGGLKDSTDLKSKQSKKSVPSKKSLEIRDADNGEWEEKRLGEIAKTFGRGKSKHRPRNWDGLYGGDYPFIQTGDIRNCNHYVTEYSQTYNEVGLAQSKLWKAGTICITIAANIAETGILTFDACFPDSVIGIEVNDKYADRNFVEYLLQSFKVRIQALGKGSAQANINMGTFENEKFPFPSVATQQTIVQKLDALSAETKKLETIYQQKMNDLEELKKSILQKAFSGQLKVENGELKRNTKTLIEK